MKSILNIENEPGDVFFIQRAFNQTGMEKSLRTVLDGEQGMAYLCGDGQYVDRIRFLTPALVLLDLNMPRMSGFEVLKWIRRISPLSVVPIAILISSDQKRTFVKPRHWKQMVIS
jgi:CheY-like chemotaxis protein